jgi:hypothetical protein
MNTKFCFELSETPVVTYAMLHTVCDDVAMSLNGLNYLKAALRIFRMIQEAGVLQPLEMQRQSQMLTRVRQKEGG